MSNQAVNDAMRRLRASGPQSALRLITKIARDNAGHDPTTCADCALLTRIADIAETGLQAYGIGDAEIVEAELRRLGQLVVVIQAG